MSSLFPATGDDLMRCVDLYNQSQSKWFEEMVTTSLVRNHVFNECLCSLLCGRKQFCFLFRFLRIFYSISQQFQCAKPTMSIAKLTNWLIDYLMWYRYFHFCPNGSIFSFKLGQSNFELFPSVLTQSTKQVKKILNKKIYKKKR